MTTENINSMHDAVIIRSQESIKDVDVFSSFNVIIISFSYKGEIHSNMRRVKNRTNNLHYVDKVNTFSRNFSKGMYSLDEALLEIQNIKKSESTKRPLKVLGATLAAGAYSILLGAGMAEILSSFFVGFVGYEFFLVLEKNKLNYFVVHFFYGILVSLLSIIVNFFVAISVNVVIISAMMAFVPGIMITNAVRDLMGGDALSGMTASVLAILISTALALGVALPIGLLGLVK